MVAFEEKAVPLMVNKTFIPEGEAVPASQIGATLEALAATIAARRDADEASYIKSPIPLHRVCIAELFLIS